MAQLASARQVTSLRAAPSFAERIDLPRRVVFVAAVSMIAIVALLLVFITWQGIQLFVKDGVAVTDILSSNWQPDSTSPPVSFGLLPFVGGTLAVTVVALLISTPLSVGLALFLSEVAPRWARAIVQPALEIFVGIPSVVWGFLGATAMADLLQNFGRYPHPINVGLPVVGTLFSFPGFIGGLSWLNGSLVLSAMVLPTVTSVAYDALRAVPQELRTGSLALGTTRWQTIRHILLPAALPGLLTAIVLGMTRAAGEALAVAMAIGNAPVMPGSITSPLSTLTSWITQNLPETTYGSVQQNAIWTLGLILLVISVLSVVSVRLINRRSFAQ